MEVVQLESLKGYRRETKNLCRGRSCLASMALGLLED
jgi:hypothetical protein